MLRVHCVTCYFYAQNCPTVVTILLRAGLALALPISFFSLEHLPGGSTPPDFDQSISSRNGTFFDQSTGTVSCYAKAMLIVNAMWTAWRTLFLLFSWYASIASLALPLFTFHFRVGLWIFSGHGCAGIGATQPTPACRGMLLWDLLRA